MKKLLVLSLGMMASLTGHAQGKYKEIVPDTAKVRYVRKPKPEDAYIFEQNRKRNVIFVNEEVTSHIVMPENIKLVDVSTNKLIGNQCADNIVRIKPAGRMYDNELAGTITIIGERHIAQYNVVYTAGPVKANAIYNVQQEDMKDYLNPDVLMPEKDMAAYAWAIYSSKRKFNNIKSAAYGVKAVVNNIYTIGDYFFIDFSLYNNTKVQYDIEEMRIKLTDKKEMKATNSQTIELTPEYTLNWAKSFKKAYRNVIVLKKLTFPNEKVLRLEISENQISGRVIYIPIDYQDILNADGFNEDLLTNLPDKARR
jgi:conjugative transposon TraN protein